MIELHLGSSTINNSNQLWGGGSGKSFVQKKQQQQQQQQGGWGREIRLPLPTITVIEDNGLSLLSLLIDVSQEEEVVVVVSQPQHRSEITVWDHRTGQTQD
jgi:hypothetical protein